VVAGRGGGNHRLSGARGAGAVEAGQGANPVRKISSKP